MDIPKVVIFNCASLDGRMDGGVGLDDMGLYILAGLGATLFLALRLLLFRLSGKDG